ncbi:MAG: ABC transporter ATP-binding protein [Oscillospiraceae bacterium]|nr:ABC transporter ATP-binding protein [Oscillospiraceae bacterium]
MKNVLQIEDLSISFRTDEGTFNMVKNLSYSVKEGEIVGIVGESGCGKTISSLCTMGLLPSNAIVDSGRVILNEEDDLLTFSEKKMSDVRGKKVSMIFQEPMKALDPVFTIGEQMVETVLRHNKGMKKKEARQLSLEMLKKVEIANPEHVLKCYPHQLSGGMKQRIIIGMALICEPMLLIADEPTTALDVTIQAQILALMENIRRISNAAIIFITHDLGVIANLCDRVLVMYAGQLVEAAEKKALFTEPRHPYTQGLLASLPKLDETRDKLDSIPGAIPLPRNFPVGCRFSTRCAYATERCAAEEPAYCDVSGSLVKCWRYAEKTNEEDKE